MANISSGLSRKVVIALVTVLGPLLDWVDSPAACDCCDDLDEVGVAALDLEAREQLLRRHSAWD